MVLGNPKYSLQKQAAVFAIAQSDILQAVNTSVPVALWLKYVITHPVYASSFKHVKYRMVLYYGKYSC